MKAKVFEQMKAERDVLNAQLSSLGRKRDDIDTEIGQVEGNLVAINTFLVNYEPSEVKRGRPARQA
jgi:hypothetical protein